MQQEVDKYIKLQQALGGGHYMNITVGESFRQTPDDSFMYGATPNPGNTSKIFNASMYR